MDYDDLFGAAVQLAARICDSADSKAILVANVIRELCMGKETSCSPTPVSKRCVAEDPVRLYEVRWQAEGSP